jgi:transcriptional regulator
VLVQPRFAMERMRDVRRVVAGNPWALLVSGGPLGLAAAHLACLLDSDHDPGSDAQELVIVGHTMRADPRSKDLSSGNEVLLVFQGPNGYISSAWYETSPSISTWNFVSVHVFGVPQVLAGEEGFSVLQRTIERFEVVREPGWRLSGESLEYARRIAPGTVPFRLRATRVEAKAKLSQDEAPEIQDRVVSALERPGPYHQPSLAAEMRSALKRRSRD